MSPLVLGDEHSVLDNKVTTLQKPDESNAHVERKKVLTEKRELGAFFTIGLIINAIMMTTFAIWAFGQWKQNNKKKQDNN